jgi:type VI secretion system protein ImpB
VNVGLRRGCVLRAGAGAAASRSDLLQFTAPIGEDPAHYPEQGMAITDEIPKSRLTLTYRTTVRGEPEEVQLPFRLVVIGDLSGGTSRDRKVDLDARTLRRLDGKNLDDVIEDMQMSVQVTVPNRIDPEKAETLAATLPITSMRSFAPAEIAAHVPKIKSLLVLRKLLLEVQANLDNRKEFRRLMRLLAADKSAVESIVKELQGFDDFKVPGGAKDAGAATPS